MANPLLQRTSFVGMWLSAANGVAAVGTSAPVTAIWRESSAMMARASQDAINFWMRGVSEASAPEARPRRSR